MSGYLDQYGAGEEERRRRENIVKKALIALAVIVVVAAPLLFFFHNVRQEHQLKQFFSLLAAHDYKGAYALWGCTAAKPCTGYSMDAFMQDWGPNKGDPANYRITRSKSCGSGVILNVEFGNEKDILWVERNDLLIGFSPFPGCPDPHALLGGKASR